MIGLLIFPGKGKTSKKAAEEEDLAEELPPLPTLPEKPKQTTPKKKSPKKKRGIDLGTLNRQTRPNPAEKISRKPGQPGRNASNH